jgi:hypothetical protein
MKIKAAASSKNGLILGCILTIAALMRLYGIAFGLPAIFDADEPFFTMTGLKLLSGHSLNPGWFGHPGTTTLYALSLIDAAVYLAGHLSGHFAVPKAFGVAIFTNPEIAVLPGRLFIASCGVLCVWLTYRIGRRMSDERVGLAAAALLAINALHIQWSQIIRTDVHSTVFMLLCVLCSLKIATDGRLRYYLAAGACVGLAAATKWPAASILICPIGASFMRAIDCPGRARQQYERVLIVGVIAVFSLFLISPFLILDYHTAWAQIRGEAASGHLGATGGGFLSNAYWYLSQPIGDSIGYAGLALAAMGIVVLVMRNRVAAMVVMPGAAIFTIIICSQSLIWARWAIPLLPFIALTMAAGFFWLGDRVRVGFGARPAIVFQVLLGVGVAIPMLLTWNYQTRERLNDTRSRASSWIWRNLPESSSIALEYFAFDLLRGQRRIYFPAGTIGCVYANEVLRGGVKYNRTTKWRAGRTIVDLGTVDEPKLDTCRADYAIFTNYDRYLSAGPTYRNEIATYRKLAEGGTLLKTFTPQPGEIGGPIVRIYKLKSSMTGPRL